MHFWSVFFFLHCCCFFFDHVHVAFLLIPCTFRVCFILCLNFHSSFVSVSLSVMLVYETFVSFALFFGMQLWCPTGSMLWTVQFSFVFASFFLQKLIFTPNYFHFSLPLAGCDWKCICRALVQFRSVVCDSFPCTICRRLLILDNYTNHLAHTNGTVLSTQCKVHPPVSSIITLISREQPLRRGSINFVCRWNLAILAVPLKCWLAEHGHTMQPTHTMIGEN